MTALRNLGVGHWARGQSQVARSRLMGYGLWSLVGLSALAGVTALARPTPAPPKVEIPEPTTGAEGFAAVFVSAWLRATPDHPEVLAPFFPASFAARAPYVDPDNAPPPVDVGQVVALDADLLSPGYWSVLLAADVTAGTRSTRYYRVAVGRVDGRYVAGALPAETTPPLGGVKVPVAALGSPGTPGQTDPLAIVSTRFLGALLTGVGDVTTFTSPGANIAPVRPAPYVSIELLTIATGGVDRAERTVEVGVSLSATDAVGHNWTLSYPLLLRERDKRWEVAEVLPAPTLGAQPDLLTPPTSVRVAPVVTTAVPRTIPSPTTTVGSTR